MACDADGSQALEKLKMLSGHPATASCVASYNLNDLTCEQAQGLLETVTAHLLEYGDDAARQALFEDGLLTTKEQLTHAWWSTQDAELSDRYIVHMLVQDMLSPTEQSEWANKYMELPDEGTDRVLGAIARRGEISTGQYNDLLAYAHERPRLLLAIARHGRPSQAAMLSTVLNVSPTHGFGPTDTRLSEAGYAECLDTLDTAHRMRFMERANQRQLIVALRETQWDAEIRQGVLNSKAPAWVKRELQKREAVT